MSSNRIEPFSMTNDGQNPDGISVSVERDGDKGVYDQLRALVADKNGNPMADVLIGLGVNNEIYVRVASNDADDRERVIMIYPLRESDEAVEFEV